MSKQFYKINEMIIGCFRPKTKKHSHNQLLG